MRINAGQDEWDKDYHEGRWQRLRSLKEVGHYSVIAGYYRHFRGGGLVLDVGCGEGILQEHLRSFGYSRYLGIDVSQVAVDKASSKQDDNTTFKQADAMTFTTAELFDVIIFNEVLYYFNEPQKVLCRFQHFLKDNGVLISSMYAHQRRPAVLRNIRSLFAPLIEITVTANRKTSWRIDVFRRKEQGV